MLPCRSGGKDSVCKIVVIVKFVKPNDAKVIAVKAFHEKGLEGKWKKEVERHHFWDVTTDYTVVDNGRRGVSTESREGLDYNKEFRFR